MQADLQTLHIPQTQMFPRTGAEHLKTVHTSDDKKNFSAKIVGKVWLEKQAYWSTEMVILKLTFITIGMAVMQNTITRATEID